MKHHYGVKSLLILVGLILLLGQSNSTRHAFGAVQQPAYNWNIECADCSPDVKWLSDRSMQLDSADRPHIIFGGSVVYHTWYDGVQWQREVVDGELAFTFMYSIDLDALDYPHVAYFSGPDASFASIKYAYKDALGWHVEVVEPGVIQDSNGPSCDPSIIVGADGYPRISYFDGNTDTIKYAYKDLGGWHKVTIQSNIAGWGTHTSLVLDANQYPHIAYNDYNSSSGLKYAYQDVSGWHIQIVYASATVFGEFSLALDPEGYANIAYTEYPNYYLKFAYQDGSGWHIQDVYTAQFWSGRQPSLTIDAQGYAHISHGAGSGETTLDLMYTRQSASGWNTQTLDPNQSEGFWSSIDLKSDGYPCISYYSGPGDDDGSWQGDLKFGCNSPSGWSFQMVHRGGKLGADPSLALDLGNSPHVAHIAETKQQLLYAYRSGTQWQSEIVDQVGYASIGASLTVDSRGYPRIAYVKMVDGNFQIKYAFKDHKGWHNEIVDTYGSYISVPVMRLDAHDVPRIVYYNPTANVVKYLVRQPCGWKKESLANSAGCERPYMVVDDDGFPHVILNCDRLRYYYQDNAGWHIETPNGDFTTAGSGELAFDPMGNIHISFLSYMNIYYNYKDSSGWHTPQFIFNPHTSYIDIRADSSGKPFIAYSDGNLMEQRIAYRNGTGWQIDVVDVTGFTHAGASLALADNRSPCMAISDGGFWDLKFGFVEHALSALSIENNYKRVQPGQITRFEAVSDGPCNTTYTWDFGDGQGGVGSVISHAYAVPGSYTIVLTATVGVDLLTSSATIEVGDQENPVFLPLTLINCH